MFAKVVLLALGTLAAIAGHHPWDGPVLASLTATHGLHLGDLPAVTVAAVLLTRWTAAVVPSLRPVTS